MGVFLAVAALLLLMNGLFFFILKNAARRLGKFSKLNMLHAANIYDELLENRELELKDIQRRIDEGKAALEAASRDGRGDAAGGGAVGSGEYSAPGPVPLPGGRYRDGDFAGSYRLLRGLILSDREAGVESALARIGREGGITDAGEDGARNPAEEILTMLDLDTRYRLCCLGAEGAFGILEEALTDPAHAELLGGYLETEAGGIEGFFDYLGIRSFTESPEIVVRTGEMSDSFERELFSGRRVVTEYDEGVCEGVYVISGGRAYDFSVRNGEING
jgi:hypothetical protein